MWSTSLITSPQVSDLWLLRKTKGLSGVSKETSDSYLYTVKPPIVDTSHSGHLLIVDTLWSDGAFFAGFKPLYNGHSLKWTSPYNGHFFTVS